MSKRDADSRNEVVAWRLRIKEFVIDSGQHVEICILMRRGIQPEELGGDDRRRPGPVRKRSG